MAFWERNTLLTGEIDLNLTCKLTESTLRSLTSHASETPMWKRSYENVIINWNISKWSDKVKMKMFYRPIKKQSHKKFNKVNEREVNWERGEIVTCSEKLQSKTSTGRWHYKMLHDLMGNGSYKEMKWKAKDRKLWRRHLKFVKGRTPQETRNICLHWSKWANNARHMRPYPWPLNPWAKNWHNGYSCSRDRSHQF